jgi:hypothetical protein
VSDRKAAIDREAMRRMVRDVLREALPEAIKAKGALRAVAEKAVAAASPAAPAVLAAKMAPPARPAPSDRQAAAEEVSLQSDQDLARFVRRLVHLLEDPATRDAVKSGRQQFKLKRSQAMAAPAPQARPAGAVEKIHKGVVKESTVAAAAKAGARLLIGRGVVVTPLARDKARQLGVQIERDV